MQKGRKFEKLRKANSQFQILIRLTVYRALALGFAFNLGNALSVLDYCKSYPAEFASGEIPKTVEPDTTGQLGQNSRSQKL